LSVWESSDVTETLRIVETKDVSVSELGSVYDEILAPSFRAAELESRATVLGALTADNSMPGGLLAVDPAGLIVGTIIGGWFAECRVMLISYLAVRPEYRGRGVGKLLLAEAFPLWRARFAPALILGEVEDPRYYRERDPLGFGDADARLRLYGALGARILAIPYFQPAISRLQPRVYHMLLMVFDADPSAMKGDNAVDAKTVSCFIDKYVLRSEVRPDDDDAKSLRDALRGKSGIPLLSPADYLQS
jgi:GNAT superfamily N-acetyltransferase